MFRQFLAVAQTGSITAACQRINVTQPTITVGIRKLEALYGVSLFDRSSKGMVLTEAGRILYDHAQVIARIENHAAANLDALRRGQLQALRIGCGYAWWEFFVRDVVDGYRSDVPDAAIHAAIFNTLDGLSKLVSCDIALFVGHHEPRVSPSAGLSFEKLFDVEDAFFVRKGHPLAELRCSQAELESYDIIDTVPVEFAHHGIADRFSDTASTVGTLSGPRRVYSSNSMTVVIDLLRSSDAVITYPATSTDFFATKGIVRLEVEHVGEAKPVGIYFLDESRTDGHLLELQDRIRAAVARRSHKSVTAP